MKKTIALLPGDGIGPEVTAEAVRVLDTVAARFGHEFIYDEAAIGAAAIDSHGDPFPDETKATCLRADAILFGAIGDPKYDNDPTATVRPEQGLLAMRQALGLYANIRPVTAYAGLEMLSPLRSNIITGVDFVVVRELIGGIYFGKRGRSDDGTSAYDTCSYSVEEVERIVRYGFELAATRRQHLTIVDKANVLETSRLWREVAKRVAPMYPQIEVDFLFVDNAAMQLIQRPTTFDVIVTENMFGDILTDEASVITGSLGMLPSASVGGSVSLYEPIHGSYPQVAGQNVANPLGSILSAAMLLEQSFGLQEEAAAIQQAVTTMLGHGKGTVDIVKDAPLSTSECGIEVSNHIKENT